MWHSENSHPGDLERKFWDQFKDSHAKMVPRNKKNKIPAN